MSLVVVALVATIAYLYVRANRRARQAWVSKLGLVGRWQWEQGDSELMLSGKDDGGRFVRHENGTRTDGAWRLSGHTLHLQGSDIEETFDQQYFRTGSIGLQRRDGERRIYNQDAGNVVSLQRTTR
jgi:hypothetical protein